MLLTSVDVSLDLKIIKELAIHVFIPVVLLNLTYLLKSFNDFTKNLGKEDCA